MLSRFGQIIMLAVAYFMVPVPGHAQSKPAGGVVLGKTFYYKNWAAGCDNGLSCEAVALMPPDFPPDMLSLVISRTAGRDSKLTINIFNFDSESDRYRLYIDGQLIDTGPILSDNIAPITVTGKDAMKLARAIVRGNDVQIIDGNNQALGRVSLAGSAAALRYLDSRQGRSGTPDAIAATGRKVIEPLTQPVPVITARKITPGDTVPGAADIVALVEDSKCEDERFGVTEDSAYSLGTVSGRPKALVLISCGSGAYNFSSIAYIGIMEDSGKWDFSPADFDYRSDSTSEVGNLEILINADWDPSSQSLSSYTKGRGIGDCGQSADYVWDGAMFRLKHARVMDECRGSIDWITVWRAEVEFDG